MIEKSDRLQGRDIVVVGQQPWDISIGSNCKNISLEWSKYNRVLYVNSALDRISKYRLSQDPKILKRLSVIAGLEPSIVPIQDNLWNLYPDRMIESINWIKSQFIFELLNKRNNKIFANSISMAIKALGFEDVVLFNDNDMFRSFHLKDLLKPAVSIYYSRDFMLAVDYWIVHGKKMEPLLIASSDLCVANSTYLADYCRKYNPNSYYVGQGCELTIFTQTADLPLPDDMKQIQGPMIGYVGALQSIRLDISVLEHIARSRPDWSLVLVGPEDDQFKDSSLHQIPNVHFLGSKDPASLPAYIRAFNVCINPQIVNQVTIGNYPRKIDEYLAVGKPVVATKTEGMSIFEDYCYLAVTKEDYVNMIDEGLKTDNKIMEIERRKFASAHTWENSVREIDKAVIGWFDRKK